MLAFIRLLYHYTQGNCHISIQSLLLYVIKCNESGKLFIVYLQTSLPQMKGSVDILITLSFNFDIKILCLLHSAFCAIIIFIDICSKLLLKDSGFRSGIFQCTFRPIITYD